MPDLPSTQDQDHHGSEARAVVLRRRVMVHRIVELFLSVPAAVAIFVVFLLAAGETALFLGLVIPGELVVILGGALASRSRVPLAGILAAGILGPITGDSIGYFLGRRYGRRFLRRRRMEKWARARQWLRKRGAKAVFLGRFTAFLRSIIPAAAGIARMPYRRFLPWSVAAGVLWGAGSALLGYSAGRSYEKLGRMSQELSLAILAVVVVAAGLYFLRRRLLRKRRRSRRRRPLGRPVSASPSSRS
ncbi:MAG: DedA family protein [Acidobacteria bacterium]|nr:MAG: DedA family protein [Acidobacteriota bacterium]